MKCRRGDDFATTHSMIRSARQFDPGGLLDALIRENAAGRKIYRKSLRTGSTAGSMAFPPCLRRIVQTTSATTKAPPITDTTQ